MGPFMLGEDQRGNFMTTTDNDEVTGTPAAQPPVGTPSLAFAILFGFAGAWWASDKAAKLGVLDTKRYWKAAAITTAISVVLVGLLSIVVPMLAMSALNASLDSNPAFNDPAVRAPLTGNSGDAPVTPGQAPGAQRPFVATIADAKVPLAERLKTADALPEFPPSMGVATDRIDKILINFNTAWAASCGHGGKSTPNPHYLWGFMQEMKAFWYVQYGYQSPALCGVVSLTNEATVNSDPQAIAGSTSRWYDLSLSFTNGGDPKQWGPVLVRLEGTHWLIVGAPAFMEGASFAHTETGQRIQDDPAKVVARLEAMRQQAFIQKSEDLLSLYYPGSLGNDPEGKQEVTDLEAGNIPTDFTVTQLKSTGPSHPGTITVEATERRNGKTISRSLMYNWWNSPDGGYTNQWAN